MRTHQTVLKSRPYPWNQSCPCKIRDAEGNSLALLSTHLQTYVLDLTAKHTLTQIYYNPPTGNDTAEYVYTFPLYESSAVTSFTAKINDEPPLKAIVKPKQEAREIYQKAKSEDRTAVVLESNTTDVFTATIGNVPANSLARIEIVYLHDLQQDIETDCLKLVIPTVITPRYGNLPAGLSRDEVLQQCGFSRVSEEMPIDGIAIEVNITMGSCIQQIESSSHPITIMMGKHATGSSYDLNKASAKLGIEARSLTSLDKDFILMVKATLDTPRGFIAQHPTDPNLSAMLVTVVPKFVLPQQTPEVVLVVDRSGSMAGRKMETVRTAVYLFLASLPVGVHFNICSFGSQHEFLFPSSQLYNHDTLEQAKAYVHNFAADFGGTEMLGPLADTVARRLKDLPLRILFLTDGDIWNSAPLVELLNKASEEDVRLFSLGIGASVAHSLVQAVARAGKGYAQIVGLQDRLERKVVRMLKSALEPAISDLAIGWDGKTIAESEFSSRLSTSRVERQAELYQDAPALNEPVSFYNEAAVEEKATKKSEGVHTSNEPLPSLPRPPILQAPRDTPPLFAYSRTTICFLLFKHNPPSAVSFSGSFHDKTDNSITPLELLIGLNNLGTSDHLFTLFARKHLQDLSEGRYPEYFKTLASPEEQPATFNLLVAREGTNLGLEFSLASQWTSFVAVDESGAEKRSMVDVEIRNEGPQAPRRQFASKAARKSAPATGGKGLGMGGAARHRRVPPSPNVTTRASAEIEKKRKSTQAALESTTPRPAPSDERRKRSSSRKINAANPAANTEVVGASKKESPGKNKETQFRPETPEEKLAVISQAQGFDGKFALSEALLGALGVSRNSLIAGVEEWVLATVLVLVFLETAKEIQSEKEGFELVEMKARKALSTAEDTEMVEKKVRDIFNAMP